MPRTCVDCGGPITDGIIPWARCLDCVDRIAQRVAEMAKEITNA